MCERGKRNVIPAILEQLPEAEELKNFRAITRALDFGIPPEIVAIAKRAFNNRTNERVTVEVDAAALCALAYLLAVTEGRPA